MTRANEALRTLSSCVAAIWLATTGPAAADPVAFSANEVSGTVVDVNTGAVRATIAIDGGADREPRDAADGQLVSFNGRLPDPSNPLTRRWTKGDGTSLPPITLSGS